MVASPPGEVAAAELAYVSNGKESTCDAGDPGRSLSRDPLEEGMATTPVFLPVESQGQRSLVAYSP